MDDPQGSSPDVELPRVVALVCSCLETSATSSIASACSKIAVSAEVHEHSRKVQA